MNALFAINSLIRKRTAETICIFAAVDDHSELYRRAALIAMKAVGAFLTDGKQDGSYYERLH